ncbi:MAG: maltose ABC transporter substrate-binding protein [Schaalia odontolytica]|nr:maltose ABC transporter substrate-binding protein [Schaalia odontolytica]MDU5761589.1 maltose ABC transporter substrate-binding protein [Schaalia odontolytica]
MRRGIAALGVFAAATALAACNNGTTSSPSSSDGATTGAVATLTIWADDTRFTQVETLAEDFTTSTGVKVNVVQKSESDMDTEFTTQVPTGNGPDLIVMAHDKLGALVANGVVSPVDLGEAKSNFADVAVKAVTYNGQTYGVPYAVESVALVRNNALTKDEPKTYDDMIASGKTAGVEYPFIIQMGDKGDPYHFYGFQTSFGAPVFNTNADGEYTSELAMGGSGGTDFATWLKAQADANVFSPSITADIAKQAFLDGKAAYTVTGPWNVAAFREAGMDVSVLSIPSAGSQAAQPFVGVQMFYQSSKTQNQVLVSKFFQYLETKEAQSKLQELGGRVPAMTEVANSLSDENLKQFATIAGNGLPMPAIPAMGSVWDYWGKTEVSIVNGADPASTWETMVNNIQTSINK